MSLARHLRRFDTYPNRGIDLPYQPRGNVSTRDSLNNWPVDCRVHGVPWTECTACSPTARHK